MDQPRHVFKRVKERSIMDAKQSVDYWRELFKNGEIDQNGNKIKYSLKQAAEKVGIPKKTLEDYHQLLKKAEQIINLNEVGDKKMGYLRNLLKFQQYQQIVPGIFSDEENNIQQMQIQEEDQEMEQQQQQQFNFQDMIIDGELPQHQYYEESVCFYPVQTVIISQQHNNDKKIEMSFSDCDDYETNDEFDDE